MEENHQLSDTRARGVIDWFAFIGKGPESYDLRYNPDEANANYAHMLVNTSYGDDNGYVIAKLDSFAFATFPTADVKVKRLGAVGEGTPIEIMISGKNADQLSTIVESVRMKLKAQLGSKNVKDDWGPKTKK